MALNVRYFITDASGNYIDWSHKLKQFSVQGKEIIFIGGAGDDVLYVESGSSANATDMQTGNDSIYLTGNLSDYVQSINHESGVYTLTRGGSEVIKFTVGVENDVIYFADGHFVLNAAENQNLYDPTNALAPFQQLNSAWMTLGETVYPITTTPTSASGPALIFVEDSAGIDLPMLPQAGQAAIVHGGAGVDKVYVNTGTDVDATDLQTGDDHIYFMHDLEEYTQAIDQESGVYTLTRLDNVSGKMERIKFTIGVEDDVVHFANGSIVINAANDTRIYDPNLAAPFQPLRFDWLNPLDPTPLPLITPVINLVADNDIISASEQFSIISGTADANVTVHLTLGVGNVHTLSTNGLGLWSYTLVAEDIVAMGEGAETISATASDGFGNVSAAGLRDITIDPSAPAAPTISPIATNDIVDVTEAGAGITISGTGEIGATITLTFSSGIVLAGGNTALVDALGNWSVAVTTAEISVMGQNAESVTATQAYVVGYDSDSTIRPFAIDSIAPTDIAFSPVDNYSSVAPDANLVVTFSENVFADVGNVYIVNDTDGTITPIAIDSLQVSIIGNTLTIIPAAALVQGNSYHVKIDSGALIDDAGNAYAGISTSTYWNFGIGDPSISIDSIATDNKVNALENSGLITVSGKVFSSDPLVITDLLSSNFTVILTPQGGGDPINVTVASYDNGTGVWSGTIPANTFDPAFAAVANKLYDVAASFTGTTGAANSLTATNASLVTVDTISPAAPVIKIIATNDVVSADEATAGVTISGTGEIGATVTLIFSSGHILAGGNTALVGGDGNWSIAVTEADVTAMGQDAETVSATQADVANNISDSTSRPFTVDTIAPTQTIIITGISDDKEIIGDFRTSDNDGLTIHATMNFGLLAGESLWYSNNNGDSWSNVSASIGADNTTITVIDPLLIATNTVKFQVRDLEGNRPTPVEQLVTIAPLDVTSFNATSLTISTANVAHDWESFTINGEQYLAVANYINGSTYALESKIYKWNGTQFVQVDKIDTIGATNMESFTINGEQYLSVTNHANGTSYALNSVIYKWNGNNFAFVQNIATNGAVDSESFTMNGEQFLIFASELNANSALYKWSGSSFVFVQDVPSTTSRDWESFTIGDEQYLAVANRNDGTGSVNINSVIYKWNGSSFVAVQNIATNSAHDWEGFTINGVQYLAVANNSNGTTSYVNSKIYKWDPTLGTDGQFDTANPMLIPTYAATDWESFIIDGDHYLIGADNVPNSTAIYHWNNGSFEKLQTFIGKGPDAESFTLNGEQYLVLASGNNSQFYRFNTVTKKFELATQVTLDLGTDEDTPMVISEAALLANDLDGSNDIVSVSGDVVDSSGTVYGTVTLPLIGGNVVFTPNAKADEMVEGEIKDVYFSYTTDTGLTQMVSVRIGGLDNDPSSGITTIKGIGHRYDLTADDTQTLTLTADMIIGGGSTQNEPNNAGDAEMQGLGGYNEFTSANGWDALGVTPNKNQVVVDGTADDVLRLHDEWTNAGTVTNGGNTYTVYNHDNNTAQILVDSDVAIRKINVNLSKIAVGNGGFVINGAAINDFSGVQVSKVGDMNGDGYDDVIVGATDFQFGSAYAGQAFVVFGKENTVEVNLSDVANGVGGFRIYSSVGTAAQLGQSVSAAGDVNGDGLADVIIGSPARDYNAGFGGVDTGRSYVVYGKTSTTAVNVDTMSSAANSQGFAINGWEVAASSGGSVSAAGDVNGDGYADLIIGEPNGDASGVLNSGRSYVVFGKQNNVNIELSAIENNIGNSGFVIHGLAQEGMTSGNWVSAAGDVNGDGLSDLLVGAWSQDTMAGADAGAAYVVFGKTGSAPVELSNIWNLNGVGGFAIRGLEAGALLGRSVAAAGDVNGDGYADIIIGERDGNGGLADVGRSYVVFGKADGALVNTTDIQAGIGGFVINGANAGDWAGVSVSGAGDFNGDGLDDFIIGAHTADPAAGDMAGASYLVYGKTDTTAINLSDVALGNGGFIINGQGAGDFSGHNVSAAGDINGDGLADLIVGALYSDPAAGSNAGRSYVIFGGTQGISAVDQMGTTGDDVLVGTAAAETIIGGAGNDIITGNGGADVLYGGMGNDTFVLNASNIAALQAGVTSGQLARIDGGNGVDIISLLGAGDITFDLTAITNLAASNPDGGSRIESIERIDLATGSDNTVLEISVKDVVDMSGMNVFNNFNGWDDGSYDLAAGGAGGINPEQRNQIVIDGDAGDTLLSSGWGVSVGTVTNGDNTYAVYNATGVAAQMLVDIEIDRSGVL